jgi:hypothetical protein
MYKNLKIGDVVICKSVNCKYPEMVVGGIDECENIATCTYFSEKTCEFKNHDFHFEQLLIVKSNT